MATTERPVRRSEHHVERRCAQTAGGLFAGVYAPYGTVTTHFRSHRIEIHTPFPDNSFLLYKTDVSVACR